MGTGTSGETGRKDQERTVLTVKEILRALELFCGMKSLEIKNLRAVWVGGDLQDNLVPSRLPLAQIPSAVAVCPKPHPGWPRTLPWTGHSQLLWASCSSFLPPSLDRISSICLIEIYPLSV